MSAPLIRRMTPDDAEAASALLHGSWLRIYGPLMGAEKAGRASAGRHAPERLIAELSEPGLTTLVAEAEGALVGYAKTDLRGGDLHLDRLHLAPAQFGSGLAEQLMQAIVAANPGATTMSLEVVEGNDRAIAFYRRLGFEMAERRNACGGVEGTPSLILRRPTLR